jgi:hypothetical protein
METALRELARDLETDPTIGAGDQCDLRVFAHLPTIA